MIHNTLVGMAALHDPVVAAWEWWRVNALIGLVMALYMKSIPIRRAHYTKIHRQFILIGLFPAAVVGITIDFLFPGHLIRQVIRVIPDWPEDILMVFAVLMACWLAWSYVLGRAIWLMKPDGDPEHVEIQDKAPASVSRQEVP